jgi:hypothetical protein
MAVITYQVNASIVGNRTECVVKENKRDHGLDEVRVAVTVWGREVSNDRQTLHGVQHGVGKSADE